MVAQLFLFQLEVMRNFMISGYELFGFWKMLCTNLGEFDRFVHKSYAVSSFLLVQMPNFLVFLVNYELGLGGFG